MGRGTGHRGHEVIPVAESQAGMQSTVPMRSPFTVHASLPRLEMESVSPRSSAKHESMPAPTIGALARSIGCRRWPLPVRPIPFQKNVHGSRGSAAVNPKRGASGHPVAAGMGMTT